MYFYLSVKILRMDDIDDTNVFYILYQYHNIYRSFLAYSGLSTGMIKCKYAKSGYTFRM